MTSEEAKQLKQRMLQEVCNALGFIILLIVAAWKSTTKLKVLSFFLKPGENNSTTLGRSPTKQGYLYLMDKSSSILAQILNRY